MILNIKVITHLLIRSWSLLVTYYLTKHTDSIFTGELFVTDELNPQWITSFATPVYQSKKEPYLNVSLTSYLSERKKCN